MKQEMICNLVKTVLFEQNKTKLMEISSTQWEDIYTELNEHAISGVFAEWVFKHIQLPDALFQKWQNQYMSQVVVYYQLQYAQEELVRLMTKHQIPMAILKGTAAAVYYPQPSARAMGDVDFLVMPDDFQRAYHLMLDNGYKLIGDEERVQHHIELYKGKFRFELHREMGGIPNTEEGKNIQRLIEKGVSSSKIIRVDEYDIPVLPSLQNGLVLLTHIVKHLRGGLGLRQIMDWMLYVKQDLSDDAWYQEMQPVLANTVYEKQAKVITRMCQIYLGLSHDKVTWCRDVDDNLCAKLMEYIMKQGNFGNKVKDDQGAKILEGIHNPIHLFNTLQKRGEKHWKLQKKYPIFRPFAWIYTCCRYIQKTSRKKMFFGKMVDDVNDGKKLKDFYKELGL